MAQKLIGGSSLECKKKPERVNMPQNVGFKRLRTWWGRSPAAAPGSDSAGCPHCPPHLGGSAATWAGCRWLWFGSGPSCCTEPHWSPSLCSRQTCSASVDGKKQSQENLTAFIFTFNYLKNDSVKRENFIMWCDLIQKTSGNVILLVRFWGSVQQMWSGPELLTFSGT